jgi:hypothetical protein
MPDSNSADPAEIETTPVANRGYIFAMDSDAELDEDSCPSPRLSINIENREVLVLIDSGAKDNILDEKT